MDIEDVIETIGEGGLRETARRLGLPLGTVSNWRINRSVPNWRQDHIRAVAQRLGVEVPERGKIADRAA
jgi:hypothetical protein